MQRIVFTAGEPAGIGPDLAISLCRHHLNAEIVVIADRQLLAQRAHHLGVEVKLLEASLHLLPSPAKIGTLKVLHVPMATHCQAGRLNPEHAPYVLACIKQGVTLCLQSAAQALVTGPVHKANIRHAEPTFTGHTEYLADLTRTQQAVMMLAYAAPGRSLRVALVTTHLPLRDVAQAITRERLTTVIDVLQRDLRNRFKIHQPRILVCGLNPHAGENGQLGREEIEVIEPVLARFKKKGLQLVGPLPADSLFQDKYLRQADVVLAMYHDQGLPVLKYQSFGQGVNITLGLPIIRTSVDHGTALDLAGSGHFHNGSLLEAIKVASNLIEN